MRVANATEKLRHWQSSVIVTIDLDRNAHFLFAGRYESQQRREGGRGGRGGWPGGRAEKGRAVGWKAEGGGRRLPSRRIINVINVEINQELRNCSR